MPSDDQPTRLSAANMRRARRARLVSQNLPELQSKTSSSNLGAYASPPARKSAIHQDTPSQNAPKRTASEFNQRQEGSFFKSLISKAFGWNSSDHDGLSLDPHSTEIQVQQDLPHSPGPRTGSPSSFSYPHYVGETPFIKRRPLDRSRQGAPIKFNLADINLNPESTEPPQLSPLREQAPISWDPNDNMSVINAYRMALERQIKLDKRGISQSINPAKSSPKIQFRPHEYSFLDPIEQSRREDSPDDDSVVITAVTGEEPALNDQTENYEIDEVKRKAFSPSGLTPESKRTRLTSPTNPVPFEKPSPQQQQQEIEPASAEHDLFAKLDKMIAPPVAKPVIKKKTRLLGRREIPIIPLTVRPALELKDITDDRKRKGGFFMADIDYSDEEFEKLQSPKKKMRTVPAPSAVVPEIPKFKLLPANGVKANLSSLDYDSKYIDRAFLSELETSDIPKSPSPAPIESKVEKEPVKPQEKKEEPKIPLSELLDEPSKPLFGGFSAITTVPKTAFGLPPSVISKPLGDSNKDSKLSFGAEPSKVATSNTDKPSFGFTSEYQTSKSQETRPFSFGAPSVDKPVESGGSLLFGAPKPVENGNSIFGASKSTDAITKPAENGFLLKGNTREDNDDDLPRKKRAAPGPDEDKPSLLSGSVQKPSEPISSPLFSAAPATIKPFTFGAPEPKNALEESSSQDSKEAAKPSFAFGSSAQPDNKSGIEAKPNLFGFGSSAGKENEKPTSSGFSAPVVNEHEKQPTANAAFNFEGSTGAAPGFAFGASAASASSNGSITDASQTKSLFGSSSTPTFTLAGEKKGENKSAFTFNGDKKEENKPAFTFNGDKKEENKPAFEFGAKTEDQPAFGLGFGGGKKEESKSGAFSFGAPKDERTALPSFSLGPPAAEPKPSEATNGFSFGSNSSTQPVESKPLDNKSFNFGGLGSGSGSKPLFGNTTPSSNLFGSGGTAGNDKPFAFGDSTGTIGKAMPTEVPVANNNAFGFGTKPTSANDAFRKESSAPPFGGSNSSTSAAGTSGVEFGSQVPKNSNLFGSAGTGSVTTTGASPFGSANATPEPQTNPFGFGSTEAKPAFGGGFGATTGGNTFGSTGVTFGSNLGSSSNNASAAFGAATAPSSNGFNLNNSGAPLSFNFGAGTSTSGGITFGGGATGASGTANNAFAPAPASAGGNMFAPPPGAGDGAGGRRKILPLPRRRR